MNTSFNSVYVAFMDIMDGPNPLTSDEIRTLIAKRPGLYGGLVKYAENLELIEKAKANP